MNTRARRKKGRRPRRWKPSRILLWIGVGSLLALALLVGFLAFTDGEGQPRRRVRQQPVVSDEASVSIDVLDNDFSPRNLTVRPGAEVVWEFGGDLPHTVSAYDDAFESGTLSPGDKYTVTFDEAGEYEYYCKLHHAMQGTVVVAP